MTRRQRRQALIAIGLALIAAGPLVGPEVWTVLALVVLLALTGWMATRIDKLEERLRVEHENGYRQVEALLALYADEPIPPLRGWALSPDAARVLADLVIRHRPTVVVELGSGASTVILSRLLAKTGGRLISLEHRPGPALVDGFYPLDDVPETIDLLLVDGPPITEGDRTKSTVLAPRMTPAGIVVIDDADRDAQVVEAWARLGWTVERPPAEKGLAVLRRG